MTAHAAILLLGYVVLVCCGAWMFGEACRLGETRERGAANDE